MQHACVPVTPTNTLIAAESAHIKHDLMPHSSQAYVWFIHGTMMGRMVTASSICYSYSIGGVGNAGH